MKTALWAVIGTALSLVLHGCGGHDETKICDAKKTGFQNDADQAIVCYAGTFLVKMLSELNSGTAMGPTRKTQEHVRVHLLPYLGGEAQIAKLRYELPRSGNCTVCYNDNATADGLLNLRSQVPTAQRSDYDKLQVCYMRLSDAIMDTLPKNDDGEFLVPLSGMTPTDQVISIFRDLGENRTLKRFTQCEEVPAVKHPVTPPKWEWMDVCDPQNHNLTDPDEAAVFCYVASFMSKMMWELTLCPPLGWCRKTEEHVRIHFTPYMGGSRVTAAVKTDVPSDPNCTACYNDPLCAVHQEKWLKRPCCYDNSTTPRCDADKAPVDVFDKSREVFNSLNVCYAPFANYFMEALPKIGHWLVPPTHPDNPFTKALSITKDIFEHYGVTACGKTARRKSYHQVVV